MLHHEINSLLLNQINNCENRENYLLNMADAFMFRANE